MAQILEQFQQIQERLSKIRFYQAEEFDFGKMLSFPIVKVVFHQSKPWQCFTDSLKRLFFDCYGIEYIEKKAPLLIFTSPEYLKRKDHMKTMQMLKQTASPCDEVNSVVKKQFCLKPRNLFLFLKWLSQMRRLSISFGDRIMLVSNMLYANNYLYSMRKIIDFSKYEYVLVRMDGQLLDNIVVQAARIAGCKTITVQDGFEVKKCTSATVHWQLQAKMRGSVSDYCLAWSPYFARIIEEVTSCGQCVVPLGMPKYIEQTEAAVHAEKKAYFGIFLDYEDGYSSNQEMVEIANAVSDALGMPYIMRYHPLQKEGMFDAMLTGDSRAERSPDQTPFIDFVRNAAFVVGCNSSTILESAYQNQKTYRMMPVKGYDILKECDYPLSFSKGDELLQMVQNKCMVDDGYISQVCGPKNVEQQYMAFFNRLAKCDAVV